MLCEKHMNNSIGISQKHLKIASRHAGILMVEIPDIFLHFQKLMKKNSGMTVNVFALSIERHALITWLVFYI